MKRKVLVCIVSIISIFTLFGCSNNSDALRFKKEYENLNNTKINNKEVRNVNISKNNPFIYASEEDIIKKMENKESFVVYFGFSKCPWCRSVIETLIEVANKEGLDEIYYVDVLDIRDTKVVDENNNVTTQKEGSEGYYKLLEYFDEVLSDYNLTNSKNERVDAKEKRIYAPNVVSVVNGKAKDLTTGISEKQTDAYMTLTDEMKKETYNKFKCIIKCVLESENTCSKEKEC